MGSINQVTLQGKVGREPSWGSTPNGAPACRVLLVTDAMEHDEKTGKPRQVTEWNRVILERQLAEQVRDGIGKGDEVLVTGRLRTRSWRDREGAVRYLTEVFAETVKVFRKASVPSVAMDEDLLAWLANHDDAVVREKIMNSIADSVPG
jgi:single-strand DNA-binding protein